MYAYLYFSDTPYNLCQYARAGCKYIHFNYLENKIWSIDTSYNLYCITHMKTQRKDTFNGGTSKDVFNNIYIL